MATENQPWYLRPVPHWTALRTVPLKRLWPLLLAAFLLFSVIGYFSDLMNNGTMPYAVAFLIAVYSGVNACLWVYCTSRAPMTVIGVLALVQPFTGPILNGIAHWMVTRFALQSVPSEKGIHFAATAIFIATILSYSSFLRFIISEGKRSVLLQSELDLAHGIQKTLVPTIQLSTPRFEIYGLSRPSERVGGDLVDAVRLRSGDVVAYLADIAGHGLPASILMGRLKTATRTAVLECGDRDPQQMLSVLLDRLNTVLPQVKEPQLYATFTGFHLGGDGNLFYALAASPPVLWWTARDRAVRPVGEPQLPLGLLPVPGFDSVHLSVAPGDLVVVATDGVLEVADKQAEEFGAGRLGELIVTHAEAPLPNLADQILSSARTFGRQFDDQTLLLIRCL